MAKRKVFFFIILLVSASIMVQSQGDDTFSRQTAVFKTKEIPDSVIKKLKSDPAYWYADLAPAEKKEKEKSNSGWLASTWFRSLVWMIVIAGALFIIIVYLRMSSFRLFAKSGQRMQVHKEATPAEDLLNTDYESAIQQAIDREDSRLAIRLLFLQTLQRLHGKGFIHYAPGTTNAVYASQLRQEEKAKKFHQLATVFEYTWYGHFPVNASQFKGVRQQFLSFQKELSS
ncbi:MAG: DUF4129 domain-containing protein [Flavisolibacter sp.]